MEVQNKVVLFRICSFFWEPNFIFTESEKRREAASCCWFHSEFRVPELHLRHEISLLWPLCAFWPLFIKSHSLVFFLLVSSQNHKTPAQSAINQPGRAQAVGSIKLSERGDVNGFVWEGKRGSLRRCLKRCKQSRSLSRYSCVVLKRFCSKGPAVYSLSFSVI